MWGGLGTRGRRGGHVWGRLGTRGSAEQEVPPVVRALGSSLLVLIRFSPGGALQSKTRSSRPKSCSEGHRVSRGQQHDPQPAMLLHLSG